MSILIGVTLVSSNETLRTVRKNKFDVEIINIQNEVDNYYIDNGVFPIGEKTEFNLKEFSAFENSQFVGETITNSVVSLYVLDFELLGIGKREFGNKNTANDIYAVSIDTGRVYYLQGVEYNEEKYYAVTDKKYQGNISGTLTNNKIELKIKDLIFAVNTIENTKQPVTITVMVPKNASIDSIETSNTVDFSIENISGEYRRININTENFIGNYSVTVIYTLNSTKKTAVYNVDNVDVEGPNINVNETEHENYTALTISATDVISGVDKIKYETVKIEDSSYFSKYGKTLETPIINCYETTTYTIYAVDMLGNTTVMYKTVYIK